LAVNARAIKNKKNNPKPVLNIQQIIKSKICYFITLIKNVITKLKIPVPAKPFPAF
jgi:hypothetical protein